GQGPLTAFFDWDTLQFPIVIRNFQPGDRFSPFGMTGTQKLKKIFNTHKINPLKRATTPIFLSSGMIIWVGGLRMADPVKITSETKTILKVEISFTILNSLL
ncbi:MAG: tRNA lysidine(34) synthetase TilS, partial [Desulfobacterales bacterium]|nr:tRNA lysidine(34) synthetase TilS [Desulfobacterales bacterium]